MRTGSKQLGGASAEKKGRAFEDLLIDSHQIYRSYGLAAIDQVPIPTRPHSRHLRVAVAKSGYDFSGVIGPGAGPNQWPGVYSGLGVAMEAKSSAKPQKKLRVLTKDEKFFGLKEHQLDALLRVSLFGGVACLVWRNGEEGGVAFADVLKEAAVTREIPWTAFLRYDVVQRDGVAVHDWLWVVRQWLGRHGLPSTCSSGIGLPMIEHRIDPILRKVHVAMGEGRIEVVTMRTLDRQFIDQLASIAETPEKFVEQLRATQATTEE